MTGADRERALALIDVSRETLTRLEHFVDRLLHWQKSINLIAPSTIPSLWTRHVADSYQLLSLVPDSKTWIDLGSGGGFPGVVIACALADVPGAIVHLVESNSKKVAFLREAIRATGAAGIVHHARIQDFHQTLIPTAEVVTARALAPLSELLAMAAPLLTTGAKGLFPKGQDLEVELTDATKYWTIRHETVSSCTDGHGRILIVHDLSRRARDGCGSAIRP